MTDSQPLRLGITGNPEDRVIDYLLRTVTVPIRPFMVDNLNTADFGDYDAMILLSPELEEARSDEFVRYLESGLTALVLIDADKGLSGRTRYLGQRLGYEMQVSRPANKVRLEYTVDYPEPAKRGHGTDLTYRDKRLWMAFKPLPSNYPPVRKSIVDRPSILGKSALGVLVGMGDGMAIMFDMVSRSEDRADMLSYLAMNSKRRGSQRSIAVSEQARIVLPAAAASLFEIYDEIPLGLLAERAGLDLDKIDGPTFMGILESLIRERRIAGRIRRGSLVKQ
jgi:hypothetical protein